MTEPDDAGKRRFPVWAIVFGLVMVATVVRDLTLEPDSAGGYIVFAVLLLVGLMIVELTRPLRQKKLPATEADLKKANADTAKNAFRQLFVPVAGFNLGMISGKAGWYLRDGESVLLVMPVALVLCALLVLLPLVPMLHAVLSGAVSRKVAWVWGIVFVALAAYFAHFEYFG